MSNSLSSYAETTLGTALVDRCTLNSLRRLWEGPISPSDLDRVELGLRALLTAPVLVASRYHNVFDAIREPSLEDLDNDEPFGVTELDYEFVAPSQTHAFEDVGSHESKFLSTLVNREIEAAVTTLPEAIYVDPVVYSDDDWEPDKAAKMALSDWLLGNLTTQEVISMTNKDTSRFYKVNLRQIIDDGQLDCTNGAKYFVGCHRAGLIVYGDSMILRACQKHVFSEWPERLFSNLTDEFKQYVRELQGPGIGVSLPPLTALVLSRATTRADIPSAIRDIRDEYANDRHKLWDMLFEMWRAPTMREQSAILRKLHDASVNLFTTTFGRARFDALSLGIGVAQAALLSPGALSTIARPLLDYDAPNSRVSSVSFARRLAHDLRQHTLNARDVFRRHLEPTELREFGIGD